MTSRKPILVTGSHRSGTTWVGRMLAEAPRVGYIHEPFNLNHNLAICGAKFDYWFPYISQENEAGYNQHISNTLNFSYNLIPVVRSIANLSDIRRISNEYLSSLKYKILGYRPLVKDPIAVFSTEWLASTFDMDVIVLIRHPAAFASSLKRLGWTHPFSHFLEQPLLIKNHLYPYEKQIREYANIRHDIINQAILLWRLIHHVIARYQDNHKDWIFIRHEDLSRDPLLGFQTLFDKLNLESSKHVWDTIKDYTSAANPSEAPGDHSLRLDSKSNILNWKSRLAVSEIARIRTQVEDVSRLFYSDEDW